MTICTSEYNLFMSKNPILNGALASGYILLIATVLNLAEKTMSGKPDTFFAPVAFISLFTFSAALMAYLFGLQPVLLYLEGQKKQAVELFVKTIAVFGGITLVILVLLFSGII